MVVDALPRVGTADSLPRPLPQGLHEAALSPSDILHTVSSGLPPATARTWISPLEVKGVWPGEADTLQYEAAGTTALVVAIQRGLAAHYAQLMAGLSVSTQNRRGDTALHWAAFRGDVVALEALHKADAALDAIGDLGNRPLHLAVSQGHWAVTRYLLGHGASICHRSDQGAILLRGSCSALETSRNGYRCTPLMVCQDVAVKELLLDVADNGAAARAEYVRQMEDEAADAVTAEAARRLLEQRLHKEAAEAEAVAKRQAEEEAERTKKEDEAQQREAARLEGLRQEQEARAKAQVDFKQREEAAEVERLEAEAAAAAAAAAKKKGKKGAAKGAKSAPKAAASAASTAAKASPRAAAAEAGNTGKKAQASAPDGKSGTATPRTTASRLAPVSRPPTSGSAAPKSPLASARNPAPSPNVAVAGAAADRPFANVAAAAQHNPSLQAQLDAVDSGGTSPVPLVGAPSGGLVAIAEDGAVMSGRGEGADLQKQALVSAAVASVSIDPTSQSSGRLPSAREPFADTISIAPAPRRSSSALSDKAILRRASRSSESSTGKIPARRSAEGGAAPQVSDSLASAVGKGASLVLHAGGQSAAAPGSKVGSKGSAAAKTPAPAGVPAAAKKSPGPVPKPVKSGA